MTDRVKEAERAELHKTIWRIANDLRGSVDGWDFKAYVLGMLFYRFISENLTAYLNEAERAAGKLGFDDACLSDAVAQQAMAAHYLAAKGGPHDVEVRATIDRAVDSSPTLRNKRDLIDAFVDSLTVDAAVDTHWRTFVETRRDAELRQIIADEGLRPEEAQAFMAQAFRNGVLPETGTAITRVLPPVSRFAPVDGHAATKERVLTRLRRLFERFTGLG